MGAVVSCPTLIDGQVAPADLELTLAQAGFELVAILLP